MNILPARIGPTVCELLGPTVDGELAMTSDMWRELGTITSNTKKIKGGYYSVLGPFWFSLHAWLGITALRDIM